MINNVPLLSSQFCKAYTVKFWMLFKFFAITVFIGKCDKKTSHRLSCTFWKKLWQNVTNRERFTNFKIIITKCHKRLLQTVTGIAKCEKRLLESVTVIIKWDVHGWYWEMSLTKYFELKLFMESPKTVPNLINSRICQKYKSKPQSQKHIQKFVQHLRESFLQK